jgi:hypothetical protein
MARSGFLSTHAGQWCAVVGALPICPMGPRDQAEAAARQLGVQLDGRTWDGDAGRWIPPPQEDTTYRIVRFRKDGPREVLREGLSFAEVRSHCGRPDTEGDGWFDGFERED